MEKNINDFIIKTPTQLYYQELYRECITKHEQVPDYDMVAAILNDYAQKQGFEDFDKMYQHSLELYRQKSKIK